MAHKNYTLAMPEKPEPNPLDYEPSRQSWDPLPSIPRRRDRIGGAARLIGCALVALTGAVLIGADTKASVCSGIAFLVVGMIGFIGHYFASFSGGP
jgi:hypothetical protein